MNSVVRPCLRISNRSRMPYHSVVNGDVPREFGGYPTSVVEKNHLQNVLTVRESEGIPVVEISTRFANCQRLYSV